MTGFIDLSGFQENKKGEIIKVTSTKQESFFIRVFICSTPGILMIFGQVEINSWIVYFALTLMVGYFSYPNFPTPKNSTTSIFRYFWFWLTESGFALLRGILPFVIASLLFGFAGANSPATSLYEYFVLVKSTKAHFFIPWAFVIGAFALLIFRCQWIVKAMCTPDGMGPLRLYLITFAVMFVYLVNLTVLIPAEFDNWGSPVKGVLGGIAINFAFSYWLEVLDRKKDDAIGE